MNVDPLRKFAFLVTSLIAFKKLLLLSYLPPDNLVLSLITFTIFYFFLLPLRKSGLQFYNVQKVHVFVCILRKFCQRGWRGGDRCEDGVYIKWNGPYSDTLSSLSDTRGKDQIMLISELFVAAQRPKGASSNIIRI